MKIGRMFTAFIVTTFLLLLFEVLTTAIMPAFGIVKYRPSFYMLVVVFLSLRLETPFLPLLILTVQWFHSAFTIEGWAIGTVAGILTSMVIASLKDFMHLNSRVVTMITVQLLLLFWFSSESLMIYFKRQEIYYLLERFRAFWPESIVLAICSPFLFSLLEKLWKNSEEDKMGVNL